MSAIERIIKRASGPDLALRKNALELAKVLAADKDKRYENSLVSAAKTYMDSAQSDVEDRKMLPVAKRLMREIETNIEEFEVQIKVLKRYAATVFEVSKDFDRDED